MISSMHMPRSNHVHPLSCTDPRPTHPSADPDPQKRTLPSGWRLPSHDRTGSGKKMQWSIVPSALPTKQPRRKCAQLGALTKPAPMTCDQVRTSGDCRLRCSPQSSRAGPTFGTLDPHPPPTPRTPMHRAGTFELQCMAGTGETASRVWGLALGTWIAMLDIR